jgi:hypothetical protein
VVHQCSCLPGVRPVCVCIIWQHTSLLTGSPSPQHLVPLLTFIIACSTSFPETPPAGVEGVGTEDSALVLYEDAEGDRGVLADQVWVTALCCGSISLYPCTAPVVSNMLNAL